MSEYFLAKYRPIVDAVLYGHGLRVPGMTRDMLADTITHERELPKSEPKPKGSRSALPALRTARAHAGKLIEYATHPPTRKASVSLRRAKLAAAIRDSDIAGMTLALDGIDVSAVLDSLDAGNITTATLRQLERAIDRSEKQHERERKKGGGIGRPWAAHTGIIRAGCIAWRRGGHRISYRWNDDTATLTGALPDFLRDLITCCDGTHAQVREPPRRVPIGCRDPRPVARGNALRRRVPDRVIRDGIRAWQAWLRQACRKNPNLSRLSSLLPDA